MGQEVSCKQCGTQMKKTTKTESSCAVQLFALVLFIIGFCLLFIFPIGTIIGILVMLGSMGLGYKKYKIWKCPSCGYFFERA